VFAAVAALAVVAAAVTIPLRPHRSVIAGQPSAVRLTPPFPVGACLYETDDRQGRPVLHSVGCASGDAALVVNAVVPNGGACAAIADFAHYGLVQYDRDAGTTYCLALAVPEQACFLIGERIAPHRVNCGSATGAERIAAVRPGASAAAACAGLPSVSDIWYTGSPHSGRFACLVPDA